MHQTDFCNTLDALQIGSTIAAKGHSYAVAHIEKNGPCKIITFAPVRVRPLRLLPRLAQTLLDFLKGSTIALLVVCGLLLVFMAL